MKEWADEWVGRHLPADLVLQLAASERAHFGDFNSEYGRFICQFEVEYSALVALIDQINFIPKTSWPQHRYIQYALMAYNLKTFYSAFDRLARGYYEDGLSLIRGSYETFVRLLFISCHPDAAYSALGTPPKGVRRFNLTNFLGDELQLDWKTIYELTSTFPHSNSAEVTAAIMRSLDRTDPPERFGLDFTYNTRLRDAGIPVLQFVLLSHLRFAVERFVGPYAIPDHSTFILACESVSLLTYGVVNHPQPFWRKVAPDLDLLSEMLDVADRQEDWQEHLRLARARPTDVA